MWVQFKGKKKNKGTKAWIPDIGLSACISQYYMIMNLIDSERPPILCIEAAVCNGG